MGAAGIKLHPACRVRQEGFGLLFYDSRGPSLLFAATKTLLPVDFFDRVRRADELPEGVTDQQKLALKKLIAKLLERGFLREQSVC
ncbi:mycofactocin biosynthesis chaperone MftB [Desulfuromonas thiophila]|uniref:mycofactocin biosynthesis chaperone MftB n=1 Tax=Desulfuromonas thiophila TaxID=57664 RepID=UPI0029F45BC8|nr:mycofactocin biosynthesis chaperone MftB [Desulfuromonas thiophila]